jgi:hypothetical protein
MLKTPFMKVLIITLALAAFAAGFAAAQQSEILAPLDQAVNALFSAAGVPNRESTRVVPIESVAGAVNGYAQIAGPQSRVAATRAVIQISTTSPNGWSIDALVPVSSVSRSGGTLHREYGVAVDAIVNGGR